MSKSSPRIALRHRRALDVPARPSPPPRSVPGGVLPFLLRLPEGEVERVALERALFRRLACVLWRELVQAAVRELAVFGEAPHAEVHVASGGIGVAAIDQRLDQLDDLRDRLAREWLVVGAAEAEALGVCAVGGGHLACELLGRNTLLARRVVDLVVDVRDVLDERHLEALVLEESLEQGEHDIGTRIADVDARIDRRPAGVDRNLAGIARSELAQLFVRESWMRIIGEPI